MQSVEAIPVRSVAPREEVAYRHFIVASLLLAVLVGFLLAIHIPLGRLMDSGRPERTADLIAGHGQVQLLGFAGLYVMGMSLRLLPRFAGARLQLEALASLVLWTMAVALLLRSAVLPWFYGDVHHAFLLVSAFGVLLASGGFLLVIAATLSVEGSRQDPAGLAFLLGALSLFGAATIGAYGALDAVRDGVRAQPYLTTVAVTQLQLLGFLVLFIVGVGLRALPALVGRERPEQGAGLLPRAVFVAVAVHVACLLYVEYGSFADEVVVVADAAILALGLVLLAFAWQAGILRPRANRARPASQPAMWLVRGAFFWLSVAGGLMVYFGATRLPGAEVLSQTEFDAIRHALGAGLITNLILGMSMLILPEFAVERQQANRQRWLALFLAASINLAALLRVAPALAAADLSADERDLSIAIAGSLAEVALLVFAVYLLRLIWMTRG